MKLRAFLCAVLAALALSGQTKLDLVSQSKNVDFAGATSTRPFKTGTVLPATCRTGEVYFKSDAGPGSNLYLCAADNAWANVSAGPGGGATYTAGLGLLINGGSLLLDFGTVPGLRTPNAYSNLNDYSTGQIRIQNSNGPPVAAECSAQAHVGKLYARLDARTAGATGYICSQTGAGIYAWESLQQAGGVAGISGSAPVLLHFPLALNTTSGWSAAPGVAVTSGVSFSAAMGGAALYPQTATPSLEIRNIPLLNTWTGTLSLTMSVVNDQGGAGALRFSGRVKCYASGQNFTLPAFGAYSSASASTSGQTITAFNLSLDASVCQPGNVADIEISRDNTVASNYTSTVFVPSVSILAQ